jgi:hypothetical protein
MKYRIMLGVVREVNIISDIGNVNQPGVLVWVLHHLLLIIGKYIDLNYYDNYGVDDIFLMNL